MISNCCHHFHEWQVERNFHSPMRKFPPLCLFVLFSLVMQGVTFMMHFAQRMGIPGEGLKFPTTPEGARK